VRLHQARRRQAPVDSVGDKITGRKEDSVQKGLESYKRGQNCRRHAKIAKRPVPFFARHKAAPWMDLDGFHSFLWPGKVRLRMRVSCDLPNDQRVFRVLPEASQAVGRVDWPWVILEFEYVRDRCGPEQAAELSVAGG